MHIPIAGAPAPLLLFCLALCSCNPPPEGLAPAPAGTGPLVTFDLDERPLPEIPFPNDLATRPDPTSPTGRRINVSLISPTGLEARTRARFNRLTGFSTFAAVSVRFDAPLDVQDLLVRHADLDGFADDAVYLIELSTGAPVPLDVGDGAYPYVLEKPDRYYPADPRAGESNLVFETVDEDVNANGVLDPGEDTDGDGVLDKPNTLVPGGDPVDHLLTFYERETHTLILRPLVPLEQETRYAVVLTDRLHGEDGRPVRSPFSWINHTRQTGALRPLEEHLPAIAPELSMDRVAFAWSFTTRSVTRDLEHLRMGLYGEGPFAHLADAFPPDTGLDRAYDHIEDAPINAFVVPAADVTEAFRPLATALLGEGRVADAVLESYQYVDYVVLGRARTPLLLQGLDGSWELDPSSGDVTYTVEDLPWLLAVPRERPAQGIQAPFPVAIYVHGTGGSRVEAMGFAGHMAKFGIATVGIDLAMHGLALPPEMEEVLIAALEPDFGELGRALLDNRTVDINNDGLRDPAGNFWTYDAFRAGDAVRQGALDVLRLVQVLRGFDGERTWSLDADGDGTAELEGLAGDFDGDGTIDLAGPEGPYYLTGISLGGIVSSVAAPLEPSVEAACPISNGGGLIDVSIRSRQRGVPEMVILAFMGPLLVGMPDPETGEPVLAFHVPDGYNEVSVPVHSLEGLRPGDRIRLINLRSGEEDGAVVGDDFSFRLAVACDRGDPLRVEARNPVSDAVTWAVDSFDREVPWQGTVFEADSPLVALVEGFGVQRQTPDLRRFLQIAQTAADPGDPINYAPYYFRDELYRDYPGVHRATRLGHVLTIGDMHVPISTGVAFARAAGLIGYARDQIDWRYGRTPHRVLVESHVLEGLERLRRFDRPPWNDPRRILLDPDWLSEGTDGYHAPLLHEPLRLGVDQPPGSRSVVRFFYPLPGGRHGILPSDPGLAYNVHLHATNAIATYFSTGGREWRDDLCLADDSCDYIPLLEEE